MAFSYKDYEESQKVKDYETGLSDVLGRKPGEWDKDKNYAPVQSALDALKNRGKFSYDVNGDMLYQQYKNQYVNQGKQAMMDVMGQASAMTGGYGNSYAQTVGQQTYQGYLQGLNDKVPELYQLALDKYNQEGSDLLTRYSLERDKYDTAYGEYQDMVSRWNADRDQAYTLYNNERIYDYGQYSDAYNRALAEFQNDQSDTIANLQYKLQNEYISKDDISVDENGNPTGLKGYGDFNSDHTTDSKKPLAERNWEVVDDGGRNGFGGINRNAKVKDGAGNIYTLAQLNKALIESGMCKEDARATVMGIQAKLGIK